METVPLTETELGPPGVTPGRSGHRRRSAMRLLLTLAVLLLGAGAVTGGVFANFTDTATGGPQPINTGTVHITLGTPTGDHGSLTVGPINNMAQGDTVARVVQLTNAGSIAWATTAGLTLQTSVSGTNATDPIVTDTTNGLQVNVEQCSTAPTETGGTSGPWTYTCSGGFTTVTSGPLATLNATPADISSGEPGIGASTYYVVTVSLPNLANYPYSTNGGVCGGSGSTEQLQGCSLSITYNFTATQRAGTSQ